MNRQILNVKSQMSNLKLKRKRFIIILGIVLLAIALGTHQQKSQNISYIPSPPPTPTLTEDEKFILNPPSKDASRSALQKHAKMVAKLAKDGDLLKINNCQSDPLVLNIKEGSSLQISNQDSSELTILIDSQHSYKIPPKESLKIQAKFKYGTGDYGYVCNGIKLAGFMHIQ